MSTKMHYHLLSDESLTNHLSLSVLPDQNRNEMFFFRRDKNPKQARKEKCKIQHQLTFESKDSRIEPSEIWENIRKLKQLKSLNRLNFDLNLYDLQNSKLIRRFLLPLKRLKTLSVLHFYMSKKDLSLEKPTLLHLCQTIRNIPLLPHMKIKLSLTLNKYSSTRTFTKLLKSFSEHRCLVSVTLKFEFCPDTLLAHKLIGILKKIKAFSELSITFYRCEIDPAESLQALLKDLKEIKSLKSLRIRLKECDSICYAQLKELAPILREISEGCSVEIVFDHCFGEEILLNEWRDFLKSIQNPNSLNKINAQFIGEMHRISQKVWTIFFLLLIAVLGIFTILFLSYLNQK